MKHNVALKFGAAASAVALSVALVGCGQGATSSATEAQQANRAYMSQINETMVELDTSLDGFVDAVSRGDIVNMRTQADNAYKVLDKLSGIEAPEDLKGVRDDYVEGTKKLREALDAYIALYTESANAVLGVDSEAFNARIAQIQALYDEGVALLQKGDATVAGSAASASATASSSSTEASSATDAASPAAASSTTDATSSTDASSAIAAPTTTSSAASDEASSGAAATTTDAPSESASAATGSSSDSASASSAQASK